MKIDVVQLELRSTHQIEIDIDYNTIYNPVAAVPIFQKEIGALNVEHTAMLSLDNTGKIINFFVVSVGEIDSVRVSLSQLFRNALLCNASKIIVAHNHPSGILEITSSDIEMTRKIGFFANAFSIELLDSFIVSNNDYISIRASCRENTNGK